MSEHPSTRNEMSSSNIGGHVVQAGAINGNVSISGPPVDPALQETQRRWGQRQKRILDAEEAQAAADQRRFGHYVRVIRRKRQTNAALLLAAGVAVVLGHLRVWPVTYEVGGLVFGSISASGWIFCTRIIKRAEAGKTIRIPKKRRHW
ncbi:hypothetical protein ACH4SP_07010 [Streptomyces sp. NPDC021093]|uniref:hypothetical protein n=1 Tax=Streptomyces sp. NPDC021093 TaxID=3365112 RepID=UPI0037B914AE